MDGVSDDTKQELVVTLESDVKIRNSQLQKLARPDPRKASKETVDEGADNLFIFLTEQLAVIQMCPEDKRDAFLRGLLDVYRLQRTKGALSSLLMSH
jgi:hypothetical protein